MRYGPPQVAEDLGSGIPAFAGLPLAAHCAAAEVAATPSPAGNVLGAAVHTYHSPQPGFFVNAYLVETPAGIVVVDGTLTVSDSRAVRARLEAIGKPLLAVLVTHPHPDHYAGVAAVVAGNNVPIVAAASVEKSFAATTRPRTGDRWHHWSGMAGPADVPQYDSRGPGIDYLR